MDTSRVWFTASKSVSISVIVCPFSCHWLTLTLAWCVAPQTLPHDLSEGKGANREAAAKRSANLATRKDNNKSKTRAHRKSELCSLGTGDRRSPPPSTKVLGVMTLYSGRLILASFHIVHETGSSC